MEKEEIHLIIDAQRKFFASGATLGVKYRLKTLKKLRSLIISHEQDLVDSLWKDFHKPEFEVIATESRFVVKELNTVIRNLKKWMAPEGAIHASGAFFSQKLYYPTTIRAGIGTFTLELPFSTGIHASYRCTCSRELRDS